MAMPISGIVDNLFFAYGLIAVIALMLFVCGWFLVDLVQCIWGMAKKLIDRQI